MEGSLNLDILEECLRIRYRIDQVQRTVSDLHKLHGHSSTIFNPDKVREQRDALLKVYDVIKKDFETIQARRSLKGPEAVHIDGITVLLKKTEQMIRREEMDFREKSKDQRERKGQIFTSSLPSIFEGSEQLCQQVGTVSAVEARSKDIRSIELALGQVNRMFDDIGGIISEQEPPINDVMVKVKEATTDVDEGNEVLKEAVSTARSARQKKKICIVICGKLRYPEPHGPKINKTKFDSYIVLILLIIIGAVAVAIKITQRPQ